MILSERSGRIRAREMEKEALRNDWTIETNWGGRKTAIARMDHTTGASITSHESDCLWKTANDKLMISEVMSFVCSDSYKMA